MIGQMVSHYRIDKRLGGGAMGVVYLAQDTRLKRPVALKFLPAELTRDEQANARFLREARLASSLDHPNICVIHEIDRTADGSMFLVMARYEGQTLKARLESGPVDPVTALEYARQAAEGLARAGESGLVHRDVKPANLMITTHGELKIIDFGLARLQRSEKMTRTGTILGTVNYMSPEQVQGREVTQASDIWALGTVLYEMLTGRPPFEESIEAALLYAIVNEECPALALADRRAQAVCAPILERCLAKDPQRRYANAAELARVLAAARRTLDPGRRNQDRELVPQLRRRLQRRIGLLAFVLLVALGAAIPDVRDALRQRGSPTAAADPRGVAVLPIVASAGGPQQQAVADGLAWLLADRLQEFRRGSAAYWVAAPHLVTALSVRNPEDARRMLGVDRTIRGVFRPEGTLWRLTLQAHDQGTGRTTTEEFQDDLANLETWQMQVPAAAAALLGLPVPPNRTGPERDGCTAVPTAFAAWLRGLGRLAPSSGAADPRLALDDLHAAVAQDSSFAGARTALAAAVWQGAGQQDSLQSWQALALLEESEKLDPDRVWPHILRGQILARWGHAEEAAQALRRALVLDPGHPQALQELASVLTRLGDQAGAEGALTALVAVKPNCGWANIALGAFYYRQSRFEEAAAAFRRAVELLPRDHSAYLNLGATLFELERYDEALQMFEKSLEIQPSYFAQANLGSLYFFRHRYTDAIGMFRRALASGGDQYLIWGNLAEAYYWAPGLQDSSLLVYPRAIQLAEAELKSGPESAYVRSNLATYHARLGDRAAALDQIARAVAAQDLTAEIMFNLAVAYEQIGERDLALDWLDRACDAELSLAKVGLYPGLHGLRADSRFRDIVKRHGR